MKPFLNPILFSSRFSLKFYQWRHVSPQLFTNINILENRRRISTVQRLEDEQTLYINRGTRLISKTETKRRRQSNPNGRDKEEIHSNREPRGKLLPTTTHLFKLILPLPKSKSSPSGKPIYTLYLLHPSQPLSYISGLIAASLSSKDLSISFRSDPPDDTHTSDVEVEWSDSTDLGDFMKSIVSMKHFNIIISPSGSQDRLKKTDIEGKQYSVISKKEPPRQSPEDTTKDSELVAKEAMTDPLNLVIVVQVPSFQDRTQFLRRRLQSIDTELGKMEMLKQECDREAHRGARRLAVSGFGTLVVYWFAVARLTFYDYGWDIMEPITYLSGLSTVICGYLWFLYKGREVSYTSVLSQSVSARRIALYRARGFDLERWADLITERKAIRRDMNKIAEDYDVQWDGKWENDLTENYENRNEEKKEIKQQTIHSDVDSHKDVGKTIAVDSDHDGHDKLAELDKEADRQRRDSTEV